MAKQANGPPASVRAGARVASGRGTTGASTAIPTPRARRRSPAATSTSASAGAKKASVAIRAATPKPPRPPRKTRSSAPEPETGGTARAGQGALSEEEQIGSAKYLPRELPPRVFEEERFIFPETYGVNRVRLLVKDPRRGSYRLAAKAAPLTAAAEIAPEAQAAPRRRAAKKAPGAAPAAGPAGAETVSANEPAPSSEPGGASDLFRR